MNIRSHLLYLIKWLIAWVILFVILIRVFLLLWVGISMWDPSIIEKHAFSLIAFGKWMSLIISILLAKPAVDLAQKLIRKLFKNEATKIRPLPTTTGRRKKSGPY